MKKLLSICLALVLLLVPMSQALAASVTPYGTCPQCGKGTIGVYCEGEEERIEYKTHKWQITPTQFQTCNIQEHYYSTLYRCTLNCGFRQYGPAHLEWIDHSYCPIQTCCPY